MCHSKQILLLLFVAFTVFGFSCSSTTLSGPHSSKGSSRGKYQQTTDTRGWQKHELPQNAHPALQKVIDYGIEQTTLTTTYDPAYVTIPYPNGDLPIERGVCTDVVIRALRKGGVDLQKEVHEDMKASFSVYPKIWGMKKTDTNIDHRRVPNLQTYFKRKGKSLSVTKNASDYKPGDLVTWDLTDDGLPHIGLVTNLWSEETKRYVIVHNIGSGARLEDRLFDWKVTGHYRYF
jgi:hypothetical protein